MMRQLSEGLYLSKIWYCGNEVRHRKVWINIIFLWRKMVILCTCLWSVLLTVITFTGGNFLEKKKRGRLISVFLIKTNSWAHSLTLYFPSPWIHLYPKYSWYIYQPNSRRFLFKLTIAREGRRKQSYILRKWRQLLVGVRRKEV